VFAHVLCSCQGIVRLFAHVAEATVAHRSSFPQIHTMSAMHEEALRKARHLARMDYLKRQSEELIQTAKVRTHHHTRTPSTSRLQSSPGLSSLINPSFLCVQTTTSIFNTHMPGSTSQTATQTAAQSTSTSLNNSGTLRTKKAYSPTKRYSV
jgi:hypothetical protein